MAVPFSDFLASGVENRLREVSVFTMSWLTVTENQGGNTSITAGFPSGPVVLDGQRAVVAVVTFRLITGGEADIQLAAATELRPAPGQSIVLKTRKGVAIQVRD